MSENKPSGSPNRNRNNNRQGNNQNRNRNGGPRNNNGNRSNQNRNNNNNRQGERTIKQRPVPKPLTFWQKVLAFFGVKPKQEMQERPQQKAPQSKPQETAEKRTPKSTNKPVAKTTPREPQKVEVTSGRLYVGNLSYETTEYDLEELFKGNGPVKGVEIIYNRHTHKSKGYGFIEMKNIEDAKNAVNVHHEQPFMGRNIIVNGARGQQQRGNDQAQNESAA